MPGLRTHYEAIGILHGDAQIFEVDPIVREQVQPDGTKTLLGYPYTDPLTLAVAQGVQLPSGSGVAVTFPTPFVRSQIEELGATLVQVSDATVTNDKAQFRAAAVRHGFPIFPGYQVNSIAELLRTSDALQQAFLVGHNDARRILGAERAFAEVQSAARLKDPRSSGGDGVRKIEGVATERVLLRAYEERRAEIVKSLALNGASEATTLWPVSDRNAPFPYPLVIEQDARTIGEELFNGSFMVQIDQSGEYSVPHLFGQRTDREGSFRGGYSVDPRSARWSNVFTTGVMAALDQAIEGVVRYWHSELGVRGMAGVDFMVLRRYDTGRLEIFLYDPNVRPTINSISCAIAQKVEEEFGFRSWTNLNGWAPEALRSVQDFEKLLDLGEHGNYFTGTEDGIVIPIAARSLFQGENCVRPSNVAKFLVAAHSDEQVSRILDLLATHRGLRYSSDEQ
jgi:hypothetical protein